MVAATSSRRVEYMRLGISSYTYTWAIGVPGYPPDRPMTGLELLARAAELGVRVVQVADNLPLDEMTHSELDAFAGRAAELGIAVEVGTRGIAAHHLRAYLALACRLASPILRVVVDTPGCHPAPDEIVATLAGLMPEFERAGVCLAIENHDRFPSRALVEILERVGSDCLGICLDTVNSFGALEGPDVVVRTLGPWTVNLHVKDFAVVRAGHKMGFAIEGRPAGQGQLDVPWLLATLRELRAVAVHRGDGAAGPGHNLEPNAILELWTPPEPTLAATIAREAAWAASSVVYLRQFIPC